MKITTTLHSRINKLIAEAKAEGLIISCDRTPNDTYLLLKPGEILTRELTPIATGSVLLVLLNKLE